MPTTAIQPIAKVPAEAQATEALRNYIVSGTLAPGSRLTEARLSSDFQLSRATIRIALYQLAKEGLVVQVPYTGWAVVSLTSASAWELYTLRSALEGLAARLVAESLTQEGRRVLEATFDHLIQACGGTDRTLIAESDFRLHKTIISLAAHSRLEMQYRIIEQQIRMYIRSSDKLAPRSWDLIEQHRPIVESIISGPPEEAARISEAHNLKEGEILVAHLEAGEKGAAS